MKMLGILKTPTGSVKIEDNEIGRKLVDVFEENKRLRKEVSDLKVQHFKELIEMKKHF